jgi:hypothetical protein
MKTLDSWLLQIATDEAPFNVKGMKRNEKETKLYTFSNRVEATQEEDSLPCSTNGNDESKDEVQKDDKTQDLLADIFDHVRKKFRSEDIAKDQIEVAVKVSSKSFLTLFASLLTRTVAHNPSAQ